MAIIYGTSTGISASAYSIWLECITNSQNIVNNTSNVTVNFKCQRIDSSDGGYSFFAPDVNFAGLVVNGSTIYATNHDTGNVDLTNHRLETFDTWTGDITHNADGTKTLALSSSWYNTKSTYLSGGSVSGSVTLSTIPRASSISLGNFVIGDTAIPITITRAVSTFTHTLSYKFAADSGYTQFATSVGDYLAWNTSGLVATLNGKIPSSLSGVMIIKCDTYSGATLIGTSYSTPVTGSVNTAAYKPNISATVIDVGSATTPLTDTDNKIVKYKSTAKITPTASGWHGATISSITMTMGSKTYTAATVPAFYNLVDVDSHIAVVSVTDSRGLTNSVTVTKTLIDYSLVSISAADFNRTTPVGTAVGLTLAGSWWNGNFGTLANILTIKYKYKQLPSGTYSADVTLSNGITNYTLAEVFNNLFAYEFTITISDRLSSIVIVKTISSGTPIMDIGENDVKINGAFAIKTNPLTTAAANYYVDTGDGILKQKSLADASIELSKSSLPLSSLRDFASGTLVYTDIPYPESGDAFLLEIKGNAYGVGLPFDIKVQGYIYSNTIINKFGVSYGNNALTTLDAICLNGNLCFWWARLGYWHGFSVACYKVTSAGYQPNRVTAIVNSTNSPTGWSKRVTIAIDHITKGLSVQTDGVGGVWPYIPSVKADGVMEVGSYIDMHAASNDGIDYSVRLQTTGPGILYMNGNRVWSQNMADFATGEGTSSATAGGDTAISFGKTFPGIPKVTCNSTGGNSYTCRIKSRTSSGAVIVFSGASIGYNWIAVWTG